MPPPIHPAPQRAGRCHGTASEASPAAGDRWAADRRPAPARPV